MSEMTILQEAEAALAYWAEVSGRSNFTDRHLMNEPTRKALRGLRGLIGKQVKE